MTTNNCSENLRWTDDALELIAIETARQNKYVHPDSNVLCKCLAPHALKKSSMSSDQDDGLCLDNDKDSGDDREVPESADNPSIACLNENTNGAVAKDVRAGAARNKTGLVTMAVDEKEIQLDPVGISLSSSGMHLYVKADMVETQKLLNNTYLELTAKSMNNIASRNQNVIKVVPVSSNNVDTEGLFHTVNKKNPQDDATRRKDNSSYDNRAAEVLQAYGQTMELSLPSSSPPQACTCRACRTFYAAHRQEKYAPVQTTLPARGEINTQTGSNQILPLLDTFNSQEMAVNNSTDYQRGLTYDTGKLNYQQLLSHNFDTRKRQNTEEIEASHHEKRSRYTDLQTYRQQQQLSLLRNHNHSSNNDDYIATETVRDNGQHVAITSPGLHQRNDNNRRTSVVNNDISRNHATTQTEPADSELTQEESPNLDPPATSSSSTDNDGISISDLIDEANEMRKDMKKEYKDISDLIRSLGDAVPEGNNNSSSQ